MIDFGVPLATLIGRTLPPSWNTAGQDPEGTAIVKDSMIKKWTCWTARIGVPDLHVDVDQDSC